jgi:hypothetical protein
VDGTEQRVSIAGDPSVWLHPECKRFHLSANQPKPTLAELERCARCGEPGNALNNSLMQDRRGRLVHRKCRDDANWTVPQGRSLN